MANLTGKTIGELISLSAITDDTLFAVEYSGITYNIPYSSISYNQPYKVYTALLTQGGTDAPIANVLENTLGGTVVWTRNSTGNYTATLNGAFTENKTVAFATCGGGAFGNYLFPIFGWADVNSCTLITFNEADTTTNVDIFNSPYYDFTVEIRVYL